MTQRDPITTDILHLYSQATYHSEARIAGTKDELQRLVAMIQRAIKKGKSSMQTYCVDGEGYYLYVNCVNDATHLPVPYTEDYAQASQEAWEKAPWMTK